MSGLKVTKVEGAGLIPVTKVMKVWVTALWFQSPNLHNLSNLSPALFNFSKKIIPSTRIGVNFVHIHTDNQSISPGFQASLSMLVIKTAQNNDPSDQRLGAE